jgi:hypothetical protein
MPISEIKFQPGINREVTNYAGKGGFYDCNKVRFRAGNPEKIGGWQTLYAGFKGVARSLWNWFTVAGENIIGLGTNQKYYVNNGGTYFDITPANSTVISLLNPFTTTITSATVTVADFYGSQFLTNGEYVYFTYASAVGGITVNGAYAVASVNASAGTYTITATSSATSGATGGGTVYVTYPSAYLTNPYKTVSGSNLVTVSDTHGGGILTNGTYITIYGGTSVGGITLNGTYEVFSVNFNVGYTIVAANNATSTVSGGGGTPSIFYNISAGNAIATPLIGWGAPPWGQGGWGGIPLAPAAPLRLWSQSNFGDDLVMSYRGGAIYYWTKNTTNPNLYPNAVTINTKASSTVKTTQTVAAAASVTPASPTFTIVNSQGVDYGATISGAGIPSGITVALSPTYTGYTTITVTFPSGYSGSGFSVTQGQQVNFSYSGLCAPNQTNQILISSANQFTVALGSTPYDPTNASPAFSPTLVRWSDQSLPYEWTPATYNQSGEETLANGSYIIGGLSTRQETLIWTDRALYSMQYIGAPFVFSFQLMMDNISLISQNAAITVNGATYWMGVDKFYAYNGTVTPLPCSVRKYIFSNINFIQQNQVTCGQNEAFNEIWWFYPSVNSNINDSYVVYNYVENSWYYGTLNRTAWLNSSLQAYPLAVYSVQNSYLGSAVSSTATSIPLVNSTSYPYSGTITIGSEIITYATNSGNTLGGCVRGANATSYAAYTPVTNGVANQILNHESGYDDGSVSPALPITSYLQTSDFDINGGDHFGYVWRFLPDFTFQGSTSTGNPQIYLTLNPRNNSGLPYMTGGDIGNVADSTVTNTQSAPLPPNTYPVEQYTGALYTRIRGRQMNFFVQSTGQGVFWQMGNMRFDLRPDGRR